MAVEQTATRSLRDLSGEFVVPAYQRGYRWTSQQVLELLDDVSRFVLQKGDDIYFLQPIVVRKLMQTDEIERWELIDGQQRLTTVFLMNSVLRAINECRSTIRFTLKFETRPDSSEFLRSIFENPAQCATGSFQSNIDYFHIQQACSTIFTYFTELDATHHRPMDIMYQKFASNVHVLWHETVAENSMESIKHFTRLNMGRIALTGAELSRATLLAPSNHNMDNEAAFSHETEKEASTSYIELMRHRRQVILGSKWDAIEQELRDPDFWAFLGGQAHDVLPTRIDFILDLYVEKPEKETREYYAFHALTEKLRDPTKVDAQEIWDDIALSYQRLRSWYEEHDFYHWVGYLIHIGGNPILRELLDIAKYSRKSFLKQHIRKKIRESISGDGSAPAFDEWHYGKHDRDIHNSLFLFNVEYVRQMQADSKELSAYKHTRRFPFGLHRGKKWSLEHIQAQKVEGLKKAEQWNRWVEDHHKGLSLIHIDALPGKSDVQKEAFEKELLIIQKRCEEFLSRKQKESGGEEFARLSESVLEFMNAIQDSDDSGIHSLDNLALLDLKNNIILSNSIFPVKRMLLLDAFRKGGYIPPATEAVFMRYFSDDDHSMPYWTIGDRAAYLKQVKKTLGYYWPELSLEGETCVN